VDEIALVDEDQIASAMLMLIERKRVLAEGAGAAPLAALLAGSPPIPQGSRVVLVISGGNVDSLLLDRIIAAGLSKQGRMMRFSVCLEDAPGSLAGLLSLLARLQANVVHIHHARNERNLPINSAGWTSSWRRGDSSISKRSKGGSRRPATAYGRRLESYWQTATVPEFAEPEGAQAEESSSLMLF